MDQHFLTFWAMDIGQVPIIRQWKRKQQLLSYIEIILDENQLFIRMGGGGFHQGSWSGPLSQTRHNPKLNFSSNKA